MRMQAMKQGMGWKDVAVTNLNCSTNTKKRPWHTQKQNHLVINILWYGWKQLVNGLYCLKATSQGHDFWGSETEYSLEVRVMMIPSYQPQSTVRTSLQDWCVAELQKTKLETQDHGASWGQIIFRTRILPFWGSKVKSRLYIPVYPFISLYV